MKPTTSLLAAAALALLLNHSTAATFTWVGAATNRTWSTGSMWVGGVAPTSANTTDVIMSGNTGVFQMYAGTAYTIKSLTYSNDNTADTILSLSATGNAASASRNLTFSSNSGNATLTVESGSTGFKLIDRIGTINPATIILTSSLDVIHNGSGTLTLGNAVNASVTGGGGINKSGTGTLSLPSTNAYSGSTIINVGSLVARVGGSCANSAVSVAATSGNTATLSITNTDNTKSWTCASLTVNNAGTSSDLKFDFPSVSPSATVAPLVITGAATFTTTPAVTVALGAGSVIAAGNSYPLYTRASSSGTEPTAVTVTQPGVVITAHLAVTDTTNYLVIDTIVIPPPLRWAVSGAGTWDTGSINWKDNSGTPTAFTPGDHVRFDETYITAPTTVTLDTAVTPASVTVSNPTHDYTISGSGNITGAIPLTKDGAAKLTLTTTNTYSGTTTITDGTLELGDGTIDGTINNSASVVNSGTLAFNRAGSNTYAGVISGSGTVTKDGAGTQSLAGASSFTGNITITAGTLTADLTTSSENPTTGALGNAQTANRTVTIASAGTLNFNKTDVMGHGGSTPNLKIIANGGTIRNNGNFFNVLGPVDLNGGTLSSSGGVSAAFPSFALRGTITVGGSAVSTISSNGGNSQMGLETSGTTFDVADAVAGSDLNVTAVLANRGSPLNAGALIKTGAGTLTLSGANTYTGATTVNAGTLSLGNGGTAGRLSATTAIVNNSNLTINRSNAFTQATDLGVGVVISGTGSFTQAGIGTTTLTAANDYTGATTVNAGTLTLASTGSIATSSSLALGAAGSLDTSAQTTYTIPGAQPLALGIDAAGSGASGKIVAAGLDISSAVVTYDITGTPDDPVYVLATYTSLTGTPNFASVPAPPTGYTLNYAYEGNKIALVQSAANNYASWANDPLKGNIPGEPATGDFDNDGITNIVEYALGQNPRVSSQPAGVLSGNVITYTKGPDAIANGDVSWVIETSQTLAAGSWTAVVTQPAADPALTISYTLTPSAPEKNFARLKITQIP